MAERDAFGREAGEDPLAAMGWEVPRAVVVHRTAAPARDAMGARSPVAGARSRVPGRRRRRPRRAAAPPRTARAVVGLVALAVVAGPALGVVGTLDDAMEPQGPDRAQPVAPAAADRAFTTRRGLVDGLAAVRELAGGGRPLLVQVTPDLLDVQVAADDGVRVLRLARGQRPEQLAVLDDPSRVPPFPWGDVDPSAVVRLARLDGFASATLVDVSGLRWTVQAGGATWSAGADGRDPRRLDG